MTAPRRRRLRRSAAVGFASIVAVMGLSGPAVGQGDGVIRDYMATVTVDSDGSLEISEELAYADSGSSDGTRDVERTIVTREHYDAQDDRVYAISDVQAEVGDAGADAEIDSIDGGERWTLTIPNSATTVQWTYTVEGAVAQTADGLEVRWPVIQGFDREIVDVRVDWNAPDVLWLSCLTGSVGSARPCTTAQLAEEPAPTMSQLGVARGDQVVGILGLGATADVAPTASLETRWSLSHAFTSSGTELLVALVVLGCGLLASVLLWWTRGRDASASAADFESPVRGAGDGTWVFAPPSAVRPGQMGTLVDERADVIDVAATVIDLATRNYIFIEEIERGAFGRMDWMLRRRNVAGGELLGYERETFEAIFASSDQVLVSDLSGPLRNTLGSVQSSMYADMVDQGWFAERPDSVRGRWTTAGWVLIACGVVLSVVLALVSSFGLTGLAVVIAGAALAAAGQLAPARTAQGSQLLRQLRDLRAWIETTQIDDLPSIQREQLLSRVYPYALVFGSGDRWAQAIADTDDDPDPDEPLYWYGAPADWHLSDVAPSLHNLAVSLNAALSSRRLLD